MNNPFFGDFSTFRLGGINLDLGVILGGQKPTFWVANFTPFDETRPFFAFFKNTLFWRKLKKTKSGNFRITPQEIY